MKYNDSDVVKGIFVAPGFAVAYGGHWIYIPFFTIFYQSVWGTGRLPVLSPSRFAVIYRNTF